MSNAPPPPPPPSLRKFDVEDAVKLVAIVAISDFTNQAKKFLIVYKVIGIMIGGAICLSMEVIFCSVLYLKNQLTKNERDMIKLSRICNELK